MKIRHACLADIPQLLDLAAEEHAQSVWHDMPMDRDYAAEVMAAFISGYGRTMFISETGGYMAGLVQPAGFNREPIAMEYALYAKDGSGLAMLGRFATWAANMGAKAIVVNDMVGDQRLARVLTRRHGYRALGSSLMRFIKE